MEIKISDSFTDKIREAITNLTLSGKEKLYLEKPYDGFYISTTPPEQNSGEDNNEKIIKTYEEEGGKKVFLVCENILGNKSE